MARYVAAAQDDAAFDEYLRTYVRDVKDHDEYVERFVPREWRELSGTDHQFHRRQG
jgi:hemerythrin superfamily protein